MLLEVSLGEALDKLSILELKAQLLTDPEKVALVEYEISLLDDLREERDRHLLLYRQLLHVNRQIWDLTEAVWKLVPTDPDFAELTHRTFTCNQYRFRIKNRLNGANGGVREQKSFGGTSVTLRIDDLAEFYRNLAVINYQRVLYDRVDVVTELPAVKQIFSDLAVVPDSATARPLAAVSRPPDERPFEFPPVAYVSGGLLGDFIHQLSVVEETFLATGRRGRVYLSRHGDAFGLGLERAYADLSPIVASQDYVESFQIHAGEPFEVNLSGWRQSALLYAADWRRIFADAFEVSWGAHKWLTLPADREYEDTILIGLSKNRPPQVDWAFLKRLPGPALFVTDNPAERDHWLAATRSDLPIRVLPSLYDLYRAICGCKLFIGNLSAPLAVAMAAHRPCVGLASHSVDDVHARGLEALWPHFRFVEAEPTREIAGALGIRENLILGVPTLNRYDLLARLIASAEAGDHKPSRYLLVDNGGQFDEHAPAMPGVRAALARGAAVEVLTPRANLGVAASWNALLDRAGESPIAIANDDVQLGPDALDALARALAAGHEFVIAEGPPGANGWCLFAQTRACTERIGPYDEQFFPAYYEDSDYDQRLSRAGIAAHREPATLEHAGWATMRADPAVAAGQQASAEYFRTKWGGLPHESEKLFREPFDGAPPPHGLRKGPVEGEWERYSLEDAVNRLERRTTAARNRKKEAVVEKSTGPRVCLNMIVKNERAIIGRCLTAALPFIDCWVIADTGSTDGTAEAIEQFFIMRKVPGKLVRAPFRNFSQARNEALNAARAFGTWDYALLIDADMVLQGSVDKVSLTAPAYRLQQFTGTLGYWNTRLVRRDVAASYVGVTHEFLSVPGDQPPNLDCLSIDDRNDGGSKSDKGERDIRLLTEGLTKEPNNERYLFYLANTYREAGRHHEAIQRYTQRIAAGGWDEEIWASYYGIARSYAALDDEPNLVRACFDAYNYRPIRAESLALLATWWRQHGKSDAALLIAEQVARMPCPNEVLFVERDIYERKNETDVAISGFYSKLPQRREAGYQTCARLTIDRDGNVRGEARSNFVHYAKNVTELFGAEVREIDWKPTDGYAPMNPSVLVLPSVDGPRRLCLVRTVNYKVADGQYPTIDGSGIIKTHNYVVEMDAAWKATKSTFVIDASGLPRTSYPVEGFEDCRFWPDGDAVRASATVRDLGADGHCEEAILTLDGEWRVTGVRAVRDYEHNKTQKNWMPIVGQPNSFLYLCDPTTVIDCAPEGTIVRSRVADLDQNLTEFRGGSQVIPHRGGWLCLVHEVVHTPGRVYLHRFVYLDRDFVIQVVTEPWYFLAKGIEFAAGLARDGERLVASFGVNDASAHLAFFAVDAVDRLL